MEQEVALRVLQRQIPFDGAEDLRRYCFRVARNLWIDECRRRGRLTGDDVPTTVPDLSAADGLVQVEDRLLLGVVGRKLGDLRHADRVALAPAVEPLDAAGRNRNNVARFRARQRLRALVGPLGGVVAAFSVRLRSWGRASRPASVLLVPSALVALVLVLPLVPYHPADDNSSAPEHHRTVVAQGGAGSAPTPVRRGAPTPPSPPLRSTPTAKPTRPVHEMVQVTGPLGGVSVGTKTKTPDEPIFCTEGDLTPEPICIPQPTDLIPPHPLH